MINPDRKLQSIATDVYVRGLSRRLFSSVGLGWKNIEIEGHLAKPGARPETPTRHHIITLASGSEIAYGERPGRDVMPNHQARLMWTRKDSFQPFIPRLEQS
jgi:hypothetical protein